MAFFNPLDLDKWRDLISAFDVRRKQFVETLDGLKTQRAATPELERERRALLGSAVGIEKNIARLASSMATVRNWISNIGRAVGLGSTPETLQGLGLAPLVVVVGLGAAAVIVRSITNWLTKTASYNAKNKQAQLLVDAGATPAEVIKATRGQKIQPKIFGLESGGLKWFFAIGALALLGPPIYKQISKRL